MNEAKVEGVPILEWLHFTLILLLLVGSNHFHSAAVEHALQSGTPLYRSSAQYLRARALLKVVTSIIVPHGSPS